MSRDALIVGINRYQYLKSLKAPALDAEAIAKCLEEDGDFNTLYRLPERINEGETNKPLVSDTHSVTREQLEQALEQLFLPGSSQAPDTALFYFSGHGIPDQKGFDKGYLATSDTNPDQSRSGLSLRWLQWLLSESTIKQQIIWLDCCHSGSLLVNVGAANPEHGESKDRCFIASSRDFEESWEDLNSSYSVLTKALMDGLDPKRLPGRWIDTFALVDFVNQALKGEPQTPVCNNLGEAINLTRSWQVHEDSTDGLTSTQYAQLKQSFVNISKGLLNCQDTLKNGHHIERPELGDLLNRIDKLKSSTTIIQGVPGAGKSLLLANLGHELTKDEYIVLAIKADELSGDIKTNKDLQQDLCLERSLDEAIQAISKKEKIILFLDQLDTISELLDRKSQRLTLLLGLIQRLSDKNNIHIVASCREFEIRYYGSQLSRLDRFYKLVLDLPKWDTVAEILEKSGHLPNSIGDPLKELLRNPLHLNIFLEVAHPGEIFHSSQKLLDRLWEAKVFKQKNPEDFVEFLEKLADRMTEGEVLWLPSSVADNSRQLCQILQREGILTQNPRSGNIGFYHQTYYDHTLARSFARGTKSLTDIVLERRGGLFVRPILLRGLSYLRGTAYPEYRKQLTSLLDTNKSQVRTHIYSLLLEFLGAQSDPNPVEVGLITPLLKLEREGIQVLNVTKGSQGWFKHFCNRSEFTRWLEKPVEQAAYCSSFLLQASIFAEEDVWGLLETYWLKDPAYDLISIQILMNIHQWSYQRIRFVKKIFQRSKIRWPNVLEISGKISKQIPDEAITVIRAHLDYLLAEAIEAGNVLPPELPPEANQVEQYLHNYRYDSLNPLKKLLERNQNFFRIEDIAKGNPQTFLDKIWPWFTNVVNRLSTSNNYNCTSYYNDRSSSLGHRNGAIVEGILSAIVEFASNDSQKYLQFVTDNQESELLVVHRLLARGLVKVVIQSPNAVLDYLIGDKRRLSLGDSSSGPHFESKLLISSVCPYLNRKDRKKVENAILAYNYIYPLIDSPPQLRFSRLKTNRQHQLRLLLSFPDAHLSHSGKKRKQEESRAFPWVIDEDRSSSRIKTHFIGPRVTSKDLAKGSDQNLLKLFDELNDTTYWDHPRRSLSDDFLTVGGAVQQSREFAELVKIDPERFLRLLPKFQPEQNEGYVGAALVSLSESDFSASRLTQIVEALDQRGFCSEEFREDTARALGNVAVRNHGLPMSILILLERWLPTLTQPTMVNQLSTNSNNSNINSSIFFDESNTLYFLPGGRGTIIRALANGYLGHNPPDLKNWAKFIRSQLDVELHPAVWIEILTDMPLLLNDNRTEATKLFDLVICNCIEILDYSWGIYHIGRAIRWFEPLETIQKWLRLIQSRNSPTSQQAYGELLLLCYLHHQDQWSVRCIQDHLTTKDNESILCGLAHAASNLWVERSCREVSTEILTTLSTSSIPRIQHAVSNVFRCSSDSFQLDILMTEIIESVCKNPSILFNAANDLIEIIESHDLVNYNPDIVNEICKSILCIGVELTNPARLPLEAKSLTAIIIKLHRHPGFYEKGLLLFEKLLELNLREAQVALEKLDRNPKRSGYY